MRRSTRIARAGFAVAGLVLGCWTNAEAQTAKHAEPHYASLMTDRVEVRPQPGFDQPVAVVFRRAGMPVRVIEQVTGWRRVEDREGARGWVPADLVSLRRTAVILVPSGAPGDASVALRASDRPGGDPVALLEPGVIVGLVACDGRACRISTSGVRGYVDQRQLWGVAENEVLR